MKSTWTLGEVAQLLELSRATIRNWTGQTGEFSEYLSRAAKPEKGEVRKFNPDDLQVLSFTNHLRQQGVGYTTIHERLKQGEHTSFSFSLEASAKEDLVEQGSKDEMRGQVRALEAERDWLRNELTKTQSALIEAEQRAAAAEAKLALLAEKNSENS